MSWIVEQRHVSKLGEERWLRVSGPFDDERIARRDLTFRAAAYGGPKPSDLRIVQEH